MTLVGPRATVECEYVAVEGLASLGTPVLDTVFSLCGDQGSSEGVRLPLGDGSAGICTDYEAYSPFRSGKLLDVSLGGEHLRIPFSSYRGSGLWIERNGNEVASIGASPGF